MMRSVNIETMPLDVPTTTNQQPAAELFHVPQEWLANQQSLAESTNLALLTLGRNNEIIGETANNTSICESFLARPDKAPRCKEFCGRAREQALNAGTTVIYRCHAGLHCFAAPVEPEAKADSAVILGGRVFLSARAYREFVDNEQAEGSSDPAIFSNLKFTDEAELQHAARFILSQARDIFAQSAARQAVTQPAATPHDTARLQLVRPTETAEPDSPAEGWSATPHAPASVARIDQRPSFAVRNPAAWFNSPFDQGCREALRTVGTRYGIKSMALLMRRGEGLASVAASGPQRLRLIHARISPDDSLLARLRGHEARPKPLALDDYEIAFLVDDDELPVAEIGYAFPLFIGTELHGVLLTLDVRPDAEIRRQILEFSQSIIVPLEMARLRSELNERNQDGDEMRDFASHITTLSEGSQICSELLRKAVEVLGAERASLLTLDEKSQLLVFRESFGLSDEIVQTERLRPGEGIAGAVFESGEPLLVADLSLLEPNEENRWIIERVRNRFSSDEHAQSFISFPIQIGGRRIGVLNLMGAGFTERDLKWLEHIVPHAAAALDRLWLRQQAERFQLMSITDPLTGLVNRRYLDERFAEELRRSQRYYYPLSLLMIDIDWFKSYNDKFGHQAGDEVLQAVAQSLRDSLRQFDVAARYGGEEFCVVLPETDVTAAAVLAERLRSQIETDFGSANPNVRRPITISIGVASLSHALHTTGQITRAADLALYAAKNQGKNCVVVYNAGYPI
ncbi:MAG: diguanylate cyclase [Blastocatellia bacterium]